jgi:hypothetical protein
MYCRPVISLVLLCVQENEGDNATINVLQLALNNIGQSSLAAEILPKPDDAT